MKKEAEKILSFWFEKCPDMEKWFTKSSDWDNYITKEFKSQLESAEEGKCFNWLMSKESYLAHIILLDQFSRQIYRGTKKAFQNDPGVLIFTKMGIDVYYDLLNDYEKMFVLLPYMHSELLLYQKEGYTRVLKEVKNNKDSEFWQNVYKHTLGHMEVIEKFGRFPKRNIALGRESTEEEKKYMQEFPDRPY